MLSVSLNPDEGLDLDEGGKPISEQVCRPWLAALRCGGVVPASMCIVNSKNN